MRASFFLYYARIRHIYYWVVLPGALWARYDHQLRTNFCQMKIRVLTRLRYFFAPAKQHKLFFYFFGTGFLFQCLVVQFLSFGRCSFIPFIVQTFLATKLLHSCGNDITLQINIFFPANIFSQCTFAKRVTFPNQHL